MRKLIAALFVIVLASVLYAEVALPPLVKQPESVSLKEKKARLEYLRKEIKRLSGQVKRVRRSQRGPLVAKMNAYQNEIDALLRIPPPPPLKMIAGPPRPVDVPPAPPPPPRIETLQKVRREVFMPRNPQLGLSAGYLAGISAFRLEARFFEPLNINSTSGRLALAYAWGNDSDNLTRRNLVVCVDGVYRFNQPYEPGLHYYSGAGLNFTILTTGRTAGSFGGELFAGADAALLGGEGFVEAGLGLLRNGTGARHSGLILMVGFRN
ncbi:MAG: hypothetical protein WCW67_01165 [Candidatus Margulisiibacteriota bacterium]|jgi:hypothetical protein